MAVAVAAHRRGDDDRVGLARAALGGGRLLDEEPLSPDIYLIPLSMLAICDELEEAATGFDDALDRARRFGARRPLGIALRTAGLVAVGEEGVELLAESAMVLAGSPARLERAHTLVALGAALPEALRQYE